MIKYLGKIEHARFGYGGYQHAMLGVSFSFDSKDGAIGDFWGSWGPDIKRTDNCKWTEQDRINILGDTALRLGKILSDAKCETIDQLEGVPIEMTVESPFGKLISWRILTEVL